MDERIKIEGQAKERAKRNNDRAKAWILACCLDDKLFTGSFVFLILSLSYSPPSFCFSVLFYFLSLVLILSYRDGDEGWMGYEQYVSLRYKHIQTVVAASEYCVTLRETRVHIEMC